MWPTMSSKGWPPAHRSVSRQRTQQIGCEGTGSTHQFGKHWHLDCARRWDFRRDSESGTRQNLLHGWQKETSSKVHKNHSEKGGLATVDRRRASIGQVSKWTLASVPFTSFPVCRVTRVDTQPFRVLLFRRLRLPLPLSVHSCSCGRRLDVLGDHRAACGRAGVLGRRGFAVESAMEQIR